MIERGIIRAFSEGTIRLPDIQTAGMTNVEMVLLADATSGLRLGNWGRDVIREASVTSKGPQTRSPVAMNAQTMGIREDCPTTNQVWEKAEEFGDRISAEAMLQIAIEAAKGKIQVEIGKRLVGIMEPVADSRGSPAVLYIERRGGGLWLDAHYARPGDRWDRGDQFVVSRSQVISSP